jgi:hypothetical protein
MIFKPTVTTTFFHYVPYMVLALSNHLVLELYALVTFASTTLSVLYHFDNREQDTTTLIYKLDHIGAGVWCLADIGLSLYLSNYPLLLFVLLSNGFVGILHHTIQLEREYRYHDYEWSHSVWHLISATKATILSVLFYLAVVHQEKLKLCPGPEAGLFLLPTA